MPSVRPFRRRGAAAALLLAGLLLGVPGHAASTGTQQLHRPQGSNAGGANGDYVTSLMSTFYRYFIEVPPGLPRLVVEVWDADIGRGGAADASNGRDRDRGGYDTSASYTLVRPDGTVAGTLANCDHNTCNDNVWTPLLDSTAAVNTAAGHWELRVDMLATGDDINAIGVRAHDGTAGAGGNELAVYVDSLAAIGANPPTAGTQSESYDLHPYVTAGCSASKNDFDYDGNAGSVGSIALASRTGSFSQTYASGSLSANNAWRRDTWSGWTSDASAGDYGIWSAEPTIASYLVGGTPNGNYANLWFGNFQAAANPPAANPTANAFRIYLPTDAGTAPVKAYVEQLLTHKSGLNPVPVGATSRFQVTVRVVNPEARAITFSAANLVTTNVPGGGVVYAGNAAVSQGSIVGQPAVGGTGNLTWNPGAVAAGATAILTYQVNVTPTSGGQRLPVTATPASGNGTRARWVDVTGNTTQARATYQFGPLCELAVTQDLLTPAVVAAFGARPAAGGGVLLEWETAAEQGTAGFRVERRGPGRGGWAPVHEGLLAARPGGDAGSVYRLVDEAVTPDLRSAYRLVEVSTTGELRHHGPWSVRPSDAAGDAELPVAAFTAAARVGPPRGAPRRSTAGAGPASPSSVAARAAARGTAERTTARVGVTSGGLVRVTASELAATLGTALRRVEQQIEIGRVAVRRGGDPALPVPWRAELDRAGRAAALLFVADPPASLYSREAAYAVVLGAEGLAMGDAVAAPLGGAAPTAFTSAVATEVDAFAATAIGADPESDYWFWQALQGGHATLGAGAFPLDAPHATPAAAELVVDLHGATTTGVTGEHQVAVSLNGVALGTAAWDGVAAARASFPVPSGVLAPAGNEVSLRAEVGAGAPYSFVYVDGFALSYQRGFVARRDALAWSGGGGDVAIGGFSGSDVRVVELAANGAVRWATGVAVEAEGATWRARLRTTSGSRYLAVGPSAVVRPESLRPWKSLSRERGEYLVVAPPALLPAAQRLAELRAAQGLAAVAVDAEAVGDSHGGGVLTPHALRAFVAAAHAGGGLRYVTLLGTGTLDYRDLLGFGGALLPPLMLRTPNGLFPSDVRLGDGDGDGLPEVAVGRVPVADLPEAEAWVDKLAAYEASLAQPSAGRALLLADAPDGAASFAADSDRIAAQLPAGYAAETIDLGSEPLALARDRLFAALRTGATLVNYVGHGGLDRLAAGGLLTSADVPALGNRGRLPLLTAMTCTVNRFAVPGVPSLGERLVAAPGGGAIAVLGPSSLAESTESRALAEAFYRLLGNAAGGDGGLRLGDLAMLAALETVARGGDRQLLDLYNLLGDAATRLPLPPAAAIDPGGGGE